jgi:hypothetical protein
MMIGRCVLAGAVLMLGIGASAAQNASPAAGAKKDEPAKVKTIAIDASGNVKPNAVTAAAPQPPAKANPTQTKAANVTAKPSPPDAATSERMALQSDLVWAGTYNGLVDGAASDRLVTAIKDYQKTQNGEPTGTLTPQQRADLVTQAKSLQVQLGWKVVADIASGARLGLPQKLLTNLRIDNQGARWSSPQGNVSVTVVKLSEKGLTLAAMAEREKTNPFGRSVTYSVVRPDFYVVSGQQGSSRFYVRGVMKNGEIRAMTVLYDQASEKAMASVIVAMSNAFNPFPDPNDVMPLPKAVEYATGLFVSSDGAIVADRASVDGCNSIVAQGHGYAARISDDGVRDLALLRVYGQQTDPLSIAPDTLPVMKVTLTGIADPHDQNGGAAVTQLQLQAAPLNGETTLTPAAAAGFAGAPAFDERGRFAGLVVAKSASLSRLVPAEGVAAFLKTNNIALANSSADARADNGKSSVVRLICVR